MGVVKVVPELVQDVHLCAADGVFVEGVVADGHNHGEDCEGAVCCRGRLVWVRGGKGEGGVAEVDAGGDVGDPGGEGVVDGEVGGWDAELGSVRIMYVYVYVNEELFYEMYSLLVDTYLFGTAAEA